MIKKILPTIMLAFLGFMLNCGEGLETGSFSPVSLMTISDFGPHPTEPMPPVVTGVSPANGSIDVSVFTQIRIRFSEAMNQPTINTGTILLNGSSLPAGTSIVYSSGNYVITLPAPLSFAATYMVTVTTGVTDTSGMPMAAEYNFTFATGNGVILQTPIINPTGGSLPLNGPVPVTISCSDTDATIYYTTNGDPPLSGTPVFPPSTTIIIDRNTLLQAIAVRAGFQDSPVVAESYLIRASTPYFNPAPGAFSADQDVEILCDTTGAVIYYEVTYGDLTLPPANPPDPVPGTSPEYTGTIPVYGDEIMMSIKAVAVATDMEYSLIASGTYTIEWGHVSRPTAAPGPGTVILNDTVTLSTTTSGATIRYTTDGSDPSDLMNPNAFEGAWSGTDVTVTDDIIIQAYAYMGGMVDSSVQSFEYNILPYVVSTSPADGETIQGYTTPGIIVTFSEPMDVSTINTHIMSNACTGSLQVSADDFATCVPMNPALMYNTPRTEFTITPAASLLPGGRYRIRVTGAALDDDTPTGNGAIPYTSPTGFYTDLTPELDPTFNSSGSDPGIQVYSLSTNNTAYALELYQNKIYTSGSTESGMTYNDFMLTRFGGDGTFEYARSTDFSAFSGGDTAYAVGIQPLAGRVVLAGTDASSTGFGTALAGYRITDGSLDTTGFGITSTGKISYAWSAPNSNFAYAMAIDTDESIVLAGAAYNFVELNDFQVARLTPDGRSVHPAFNMGGPVTTSYKPARVDVARAVAIQPDGRIVVAGYHEINTAAPYNRSILVARYNPDGSLDTAEFGSGMGMSLITYFTLSVEADKIGLAIQKDGRIVVAGSVMNGTQTDPLVAILDANGNLEVMKSEDITGGYVNNDLIRAVAIQPNGKILLAGYNKSGANANNVMVVRYNSDLTLDTGFGSGGYFIVDVSWLLGPLNYNDEAYDIKVQPDGKIVLTGYAKLSSTGSAIFVMRLR